MAAGKRSSSSILRGFLGLCDTMSCRGKMRRACPRSEHDDIRLFCDALSSWSRLLKSSTGSSLHMRCLDVCFTPSCAALHSTPHSGVWTVSSSYVRKSIIDVLWVFAIFSYCPDSQLPWRWLPYCTSFTHVCQK